MSAWDNNDAGEAVMTSRLLEQIAELKLRCQQAESERDAALAANKLLVEALEKLRVRLETGSVDWEIATDALAAVKQP